MTDLIVFVIKVIIVFAGIYAFYYFVSPYEKCLKKWHYEDIENVGMVVPNDFEYCHSKTNW